MIVSVDGRSIAGLSSTRRRELIKGPEGTEVTVGVRNGRKGKAARGDAHPRPDLACPVVSQHGSKPVGGRKLGYVRLATFTEGVAWRASRHGGRNGSEAQGAEGLVLDLRGNGGGLLEEAVLDREHLPAEGRSRRLDQLAHPGRRRLQDRAAATCRRCRSSS